MEELPPSSLMTHSRKRKNNFPSTNTGSKSPIQLHSNSSIRPQPNPNYRTVGTLIGRIKDLRSRRVFTPDVDSVMEAKEDKKQEELLIEVNEVVDPGLVPDEEAKGGDFLEGSSMGPDAGQISISDPIPEDEEKKGNVKEVKELLKMDKREISEEHTVGGNGSAPKCNLVSSLSKRRKVFSTPSSFGYRRLMPYIMDIANNDSSASKFEIVGAGSSSKLQKLGGVLVKAEECLITENTIASRVNHFVANSPLEISETLTLENKDKKPQSLSDSENELKQKKENIRKLEVEQEILDNGVINNGATNNDACLILEGKEKEDDMNKENKLLGGSDVSIQENKEIDFKVNEVKESSLKDGVISGNESTPKSKMVVGSCKRRKVFSTPSSFGYRRLLPYLNDIVNNDPGVSKFEIVDAGNPSKMQKLCTEECLIVENCITSKDDYSLPLEKEETQLFENIDEKMYCLSGSEKTENICQLRVDQKSLDNCASRVDASIEEECDQMTPPDANISPMTEAGNVGETMETITLLNPLLTPLEKDETQFFENIDEKLLNLSDSEKIENISQLKVDQKSLDNGVSSVDDSAEEECDQMTPPDANIFPMTKDGHVGEIMETNTLLNPPVLNPCSRLRVFKNTTNSHSYRRLLPYLTDMSKNNSCASRINQHTKPVPDLAEAIKENSSDLPQTEDGSDTNHCLSFPRPSFTNNSSNVEPNILAFEKPPVLTKQLSSKGQNECSGALNENDLSGSCFQVGVFDSLDTPKYGPSKGILKKNPRGCRGPCNCLKCASFRLHADRAFEFSRNQMDDAEDIAADLMKELATLRHILRKTDVNENDSSNIQLTLVDARQACDKALEIENLAKARLSQMKYDLNIHCRIPDLLQPKVTFANSVEERANPL